MYAATDPLDGTPLEPASLPPDLARGVAIGAGAPSGTEGLEPATVVGEIAIDTDHAHVVRAADGTRWCVTEGGAVTYDCMLAWQFTTTEVDAEVRAAARIRLYPERTTLVIELVNDTDEVLDPTGGQFVTPFTADSVPVLEHVTVGPPGAVDTPAGEQDWEPGLHAFLTFTSDETGPAEAPFAITWPWGRVDVMPLEVTWLLGPLSENADDHDH